MAYRTGESIVAAVNAVHIHLALTKRTKMSDPIMNGIEEALSIERTTLEYYCKLLHLRRRNNENTKDVSLYTATVNPGFPIL